MHMKLKLYYIENEFLMCLTYTQNIIKYLRISKATWQCYLKTTVSAACTLIKNELRLICWPLFDIASYTFLLIATYSSQ